MATPRLIALPRSGPRGGAARAARASLFLAAVLMPAAVLRATGGYDDVPPPTLPYYLTRLPAKPPALIFEETFDGPRDDGKAVDFKAGLLALADGCEANQSAAALLASTDKLLAQARYAEGDAAALCNVLGDMRDLFAATPPVTGKTAARYVRWRVEHADWFNLRLGNDAKPTPAPPLVFGEEAAREKAARQAKADALGKLAADPQEKALRAHWLYLSGAVSFPGGGEKQFQQVADEFPDDPRAEAARFMLARCRLAASKSHDTESGEVSAQAAAQAGAAMDREAARALFEDYLKRYPRGRFAADVPGWLGALAFDGADYAGALDQYIQQADVPGHPEVLKSAGFMCERCLSRLASANDQGALDKVAAHPRLAMSLIYLLVNSPEADNYDGKLDSPAQVAKWRAALLPRLAAAVAAHRDEYKGNEWQGRYLAILAQAASGTGDQKKALELCAVGKDELAKSDDLAFIRLVALGRARRLPEAIAAGGEFARQFPKSPLARGAALRRVLALVDNHQAGAALAELYRLRQEIADANKDTGSEDTNAPASAYDSEVVYPSADGDLDPSRSVLNSDTSGAQTDGLAQISDALLCFAPLPELAAALSPAGSAPALAEGDAVNLRAVLTQRYLAEEEKFAEAKKYTTPAWWSGSASAVEKLADDAAAAPAGEAKAAAYLKLADGWAAARGKLVFAPLETDQTREGIFTGGNGATYADVRRRENGVALGLSDARIDHALSSRDEWRHAFDWWQKAADAAPEDSPTRARALWAALRAMPAMTVASPYTFLHAGETDAGKESRRLYERLRRECPGSREAREFAVYYDLAPPRWQPGDNSYYVQSDGTPDYGNRPDQAASQPDLRAATRQETLPYGEPEYRWEPRDEYDDYPPNEAAERTPGNDKRLDEIARATVALNDPEAAAHPARMAETVGRLRGQLNGLTRDAYDSYLVNFLDDLGDFLQEPAAKLTPALVRRYVKLRTECMSVEHWGGWLYQGKLPPVAGATEETLNETVLGHLREAYRSPEMAPVKDYLDFLAMAVVANAKFEVPIPGETQDAKDGTPGKKEPVTYTSRDYPKLAKLAEGFLKDYPHSRKREAAQLLHARALYAASRPHPLEKFAVWPESGHYQSGTIIAGHRQAPFDPRRIGAALNAYDREFPHGRYAADIRNLRGLLAWRTQDWGIAVDLTLQTLADKHDAVLQAEAMRRLRNLFVDGLTDETERQRCLAAIKAHPQAVAQLRSFLPGSAFPLRVLQSWLLAQL